MNGCRMLLTCFYDVIQDIKSGQPFPVRDASLRATEQNIALWLAVTFQVNSLTIPGNEWTCALIYRSVTFYFASVVIRVFHLGRYRVGYHPPSYHSLKSSQ